MARREGSAAPVAGPSSKPNSKRKPKAQTESPPPEDEPEHLLDPSDDDNIAPKPAKKKKKNDKGVGKGKMKAPSPEPEMIEDSDIETIENPQHERKQNSPNRGESRLVDQLRAQLKQSNQRNVAFEKQLEELLAVRDDDELTKVRNNYEARIETLEIQTRELTAQLAIAEPRSRGPPDDSSHPLLQYISRSAAAYEAQPLRDEIEQLKSISAQKDVVIKRKDLKIIEITEDKKELEVQLKEEIERNRILVEKSKQLPQANGHLIPGSATRGKVPIGPAPSVNQVKHSALVSFYEDVTNILVPDIKFEPGRYLNKDDKTYQCIYTYLAPGSEDSGEASRSLNFSLRNHWDLAPDEVPEDGELSPIVTSSDQLKDYIQYTPLNLENEGQEFIDSLGFFKDPFQFERNQLSTFYTSLGMQLKTVVEGSQAVMDEN